ncbi:MAG: tetratricopeptide repeat protein [Euryarchaeota archaeon]|nr:tetratricopeptide repeat protein [Euryarchaeota archaeon]
MVEFGLQTPVLAGRQVELRRIRQSLDAAIAGKGSMTFISGEAGIGKTRLISEIVKDAESNNIQVISGWCLAGSLEPLMPVKSALREAGLEHLIIENPPPMVISAYLFNEAGLLVAKAERENSNLDADIFAAMLKAVGDFVRDSLTLMGKGGSTNLNSIGFGKYKILIQTTGNLFLTAVIEGNESEALIQDMRDAISAMGVKYEGWHGNESEASEATPRMEWFVRSGKYDGKFIVDDAKIKQENLFDHVLLGLQRSSGVRPIVFILDDLQWADATTLTLLHYLARNIRNHRILLLATYRSEDIAQVEDGMTHKLEVVLQNMSREGLFSRLELKRLAPMECEMVIVSSLGNVSFEKSFYDRIYSETAGVPFFISETVRLLSEEGCIAKDGRDTWRHITSPDKLDIPPRVYDVVRRRLDRLQREQKEVLEYASVIGEEFESSIIQRAMDTSRIQVLKALNEMEKAHRLIHLANKLYKFDHAKIREVLLMGISEELRAEYHRAVGDAIADEHKEDMDQVVERLGYHYYEAADERACRYLFMAADKAKKGFANEEAILLYQKGLKLGLKADENATVLESMGDLFSIVGKFDKSLDCYSKAMENYSDNDLKSKMARRLSGIYNKIGDFKNAMASVQSARILVSENTAEMGRLLTWEGNVHRIMGDYDKALTNFQEALVIFGRVGNAGRDIFMVYSAMGGLHWSKGDYAQALNAYEKGLEVLRPSDDQANRAVALNNVGLAHRNLGNIGKALEFYEMSLEIKETIGDQASTANTLINIGSLCSFKGEHDRAMEIYCKCAKICEKIGYQSGLANAYNGIGNAYLEMGDMEQALKFNEKSFRLMSIIGDMFSVAQISNDIGNIMQEKGESVEAKNWRSKSEDISKKLGVKSVLADALLGRAEMALHDERAPDLASSLCLEVEKISVDQGMRDRLARCRRVQGALSASKREWAISRRLFDESLRLYGEVGAGTEAAKTHYAMAIMLSEKGDATEAQRHLKMAFETFEKAEMKLWAERSAKALGGPI